MLCFKPDRTYEYPGTLFSSLKIGALVLSHRKISDVEFCTSSSNSQGVTRNSSIIQYIPLLEKVSRKSLHASCLPKSKALCLAFSLRSPVQPKRNVHPRQGLRPHSSQFDLHPPLNHQMNPNLKRRDPIKSKATLTKKIFYVG